VAEVIKNAARFTKVLTTEGSKDTAIGLDMMPERLNGWCWDDIGRQWSPDPGKHSLWC